MEIERFIRALIAEAAVVEGDVELPVVADHDALTGDPSLFGLLLLVLGFLLLVLMLLDDVEDHGLGRAGRRRCGWIRNWQCWDRGRRRGYRRDRSDRLNCGLRRGRVVDR